MFDGVLNTPLDDLNNDFMISVRGIEGWCKKPRIKIFVVMS